jgi:outer membrane protein assembly factor BamB
MAMRLWGSVVAGSIIVVSLFAPTVNAAPGETRMYQGDEAHTGRLVGARVGSSLASAWSLDTHYLVVTPLVSNGMVYVDTHPADDWHGPNEVTALDVATGTRRWSTPLPTGQLGGDRTYLATDGSRVYAVVWSSVYALDAQTGRVVWSATDGQWSPTPPILHDGALIFQSSGYGATLYAFRTSDGRLLWQAPAGNGPVVAATGLGFMTGDCESRVAIDLATGSRAYLQEGICGGGAESPAAFDGRYVWAATPDASVPSGYVYDPTDGTRIASFAGQPPAIAAPYAYNANLDRVVALDLTTRAQAWATQLDGNIVTAPLVIDDTVAARTHDSVYLLNRMTGAVIWRQPVTRQAAYYLTTGSRIGLAAGDGYLVVPTDGHIDVLRGDGVPSAVEQPAADATQDIHGMQGARTAPATGRATSPHTSCRPRTVRLPRELRTAHVRAGRRQLAVRRSHGRLMVTVPATAASAGVAHLVIRGRTYQHRIATRHRAVRVCPRA